MPRVIITVPDRNSQPYRFLLDRQVVSLGRGSENDIAIDSGSVSVLHAEMRRISGGYELKDVGSTNGIKLGDTRQETISLRNGMAVRLGDVAFEFSLTDEEQQELLLEAPAQSPIIKETQLTPSPQKQVSAEKVYRQPASSSSGSMATLVFLLLAAMAFFAGLAVRHQKETDRSLFDAIRSRSTPVPPPALLEEPQVPPQNQGKSSLSE